MFRQLLINIGLIERHKTLNEELEEIREKARIKGFREIYEERKLETNEYSR